MKVVLELEPEIEEKIRKQATRQDMKIEDYVVMIIEEELQTREKDGIRDKTELR